MNKTIKQILDLINDLKYGTIQIKIQDSQIVLIKKIESIKPESEQ